MGLLDAFRQYVDDASPGGILNAEWTPERRQAAVQGLLDFVPFYEAVTDGMIPVGLFSVQDGKIVPETAYLANKGKAADMLRRKK